MFSFVSPRASADCGFMPTPCAPTGRSPVQLGSAPSGNVDGTWTDKGPQVNVPWVNEFGEREVRATDGMIPGGNPVGGGVIGPRTWWTNYWSVYDSSINGYYFYVPIATTGESGGTDRLYILNPQTMTVSTVCSTWSNCEMPYAGSWSTETPGRMYYSAGEDLCSYDYDTRSGSGTCSDGVGTLVFKFSTCPDYGKYYSGGIYLDGVSFADKLLEASFGATTMATYDTGTGSCYWWSTRYGLVGGTDMSAEPASLAVADPPTLPSRSLTATSGAGSVPAGTYYIELTRVTEGGTAESQPVFETTPSAQRSVTLTAEGEITISGQSVPSDFYTDNWDNTCNVYAGTKSGGETLQTSFQSCSDTITLSRYTTSGAPPPTLNGGGFGLHGSAAGAGPWFTAEPETDGEVKGKGTTAYVLWNPGTANTVECITEGDYPCEGHESVGSSNIFYVIYQPPTGGVPAQYDVGLSPNADSSSSNYTHLIPSGPPLYNPYDPNVECNVADTHNTWTYDDPSDTMPVVQSSFVDSFVGLASEDGTVSVSEGSTAVRGSGTSFSASWVGKYIWIGSESGAGLGVGAWAEIAAVGSGTSLTLSGDAPLAASASSFYLYDYPVMENHCAWDHEIDAVSPTGRGTVWRFAHNRASGLQNQRSNTDSSYQALSMPVCSPDGKYCMWATDWANSDGQGQLGTQTGMWRDPSLGNPAGGCYRSCAWRPDTTYAQYQEVIDSHGNEEMATVGGTSGNAEPSWPTSVNGKVTDGDVTWEMSPGCNTAQSISAPVGGPTDGDGMCRTDVFIVEMK